MDGNYKRYDFIASSARIREILDQPQGQFEETDSLPDRDKLTYTNGYYARCSAIFVDIRDSSGLTDKYNRPQLAKIYRAFISEMVAVLNGDAFVREVNIVGDCVWATYNTPKKPDVDDVLSIAAFANTLIGLLNAHLKKSKLDPIRAGIGVDYGRVLMIKAGHKGSGLQDVVYMGDVVNRAAHLASKAGRGSNQPIWAGADIHLNVNDQHKGLLTSRHDSELGTVYVGNIIRTEMKKWIEKNFKS